MQNLELICDKIHRKILNARSVYQMIISERFRMLWESSSEQEQKRIESVIYSYGKDELSIWMKHHPETSLGELSIQRLRERAKRLRIKNYCRLVRYELVREIDRIMKEKD